MTAAAARALGLCAALGALAVTAAAQSRPNVLIVETRVLGIDPVVGRFTDRELQRSAAALGYRVMQAAEARELMRALAIDYPPTAADLGVLARRGRLEQVAFATASARGGQYVVRLEVVSFEHRTNREVPAWAQGASGTQGLGQMLEGLVRQVMPPRRPAAAPKPPPSAPAPPAATSTAPTARPPEAVVAAAQPQPAHDDASEPPSLREHWRLALQTEPAFGIADDFFYNHLFGARIDYRFDEATSLGSYLAYANLRGRDGRVGSALWYLQLEHRIAIEGSALTVPVRLAGGYLARNGVVIRTASGIAWPIADGVDVVLDLLSPVLWVTPERRLLSLDVGVEVAWLL